MQCSDLHDQHLPFLCYINWLERAGGWLPLLGSAYSIIALEIMARVIAIWCFINWSVVFICYSSCLYMPQTALLRGAIIYRSMFRRINYFFCKIIQWPSRLSYVVPEALMSFVAKTSSSWKKLSMKALQHVFGKTSRRDRTTVSSTPQIFLLVQSRFISRLFGLQIFIAFFSK